MQRLHGSWQDSKLIQNLFLDPFTTLLHKADSFFKKLSLKRLKLGTILNFIDKLGMKDSAKKIAEVMKTIKVRFNA